MAKKISIIFLLLFIIINNGFSSDLSEAKALREKCEKESTYLKISVTNFGDEKDKENFSKGIKLVNLGKVKLAQSKYLPAKEKYKKYLKLQNIIYKSVAEKYLVRTEKMIDEISEELVDYIDNKKIAKYFKLASQNHFEGKASFGRRHYSQTIEDCRKAKEYILGSYKLANKKIPVQYKTDIKDNNRK